MLFPAQFILFTNHQSLPFSPSKVDWAILSCQKLGSRAGQHHSNTHANIQHRHRIHEKGFGDVLHFKSFNCCLLWIGSNSDWDERRATYQIREAGGNSGDRNHNDPHPSMQFVYGTYLVRRLSRSRVNLVEVKTMTLGCLVSGLSSSKENCWWCIWYLNTKTINHWTVKNPTPNHYRNPIFKTSEKNSIGVHRKHQLLNHKHSLFIMYFDGLSLWCRSHWK